MKPYHCILASFLLAALLIPVFLSEPCSAAFIPGNNIILERGGMIWEYDEKITDNEAVFFRNLIDTEKGNSDGFVNAWEILKMEVLLNKRMKRTIEEEPDVKLNSTPDTVELKDVEFRVSREALGRTEKNSSIINRASVGYSFREEVVPGTAIQLTGTPGSNVMITLPPGLGAELTEGFNNKTSGFENNRTVLKGNFGPEGNITLLISENESSGFEMQDMKISIYGKTEGEKTAGENSTAITGVNIEAGQPSRFFQNISKKLTGACLNPKS